MDQYRKKWWWSALVAVEIWVGRSGLDIIAWWGKKGSKQTATRYINQIPIYVTTESGKHENVQLWCVLIWEQGEEWNGFLKYVQVSCKETATTLENAALAFHLLIGIFLDVTSRARIWIIENCVILFALLSVIMERIDEVTLQELLKTCQLHIGLQDS